MKLIFIFFLFFIISCNSNDKNGDLKQFDNKSKKVTKNLNLQFNLVEYHKPILGYRFKIFGDFDGDGFQDTLQEHYQNKNKVEINKYYDNITDYWYFVESTISKKPTSFLSCDNAKIDTLFLSKYIDNQYQHLGLSFLKNLGDLNGDGNDELSYVMKWADFSNCNTLHTFSYVDGKWIDIYAFSIWDFQIPDTPDIKSIYWDFGLEKLVILDNENYQNSENEIENFHGLVKKVKKNLIQIEVINDDAEFETTFVDLKTKKRVNLLQIRN